MGGRERGREGARVGRGEKFGMGVREGMERKREGQGERWSHRVRITIFFSLVFRHIFFFISAYSYNMTNDSQRSRGWLPLRKFYVKRICAWFRH